MKKRKINKILIVRPDAIGDFISITPVLSAIKKSDPGIKITLLASRANLELAKTHPLIDEVILDRIREGRVRNIFDLIGYAWSLRENKFDAALIFYNELPYALLCLLARIPARVGDKDKLLLSPFYNCGTHINNADQTKSVLEYNLQYAQALGFDTSGCELNLPEPKNKYPINGTPLIGIHLGHIGGTAAKRKLPQEKYVQILDRIFSLLPGSRVVLLGTGEMKNEAEYLSAGARGAVTDLVGRTTLSELMSIISELNVYIGVETGPTQIAAAYKIPMVFINAVKCLKPQRWAPLHSPKVIVRLKTRCNRTCHYASCPDESCSHSISAEEVANGVKELLSNNLRINSRLNILSENSFSSSDPASNEFLYSFTHSNNITFVADREPDAADRLRQMNFIVDLIPISEFRLLNIKGLLDRITYFDTTILHSTVDRPFLIFLLSLLAPSRLLTPPLMVYNEQILDSADNLVKFYVERFKGKTHV